MTLIVVRIVIRIACMPRSICLSGQATAAIGLAVLLAFLLGACGSTPEAPAPASPGKPRPATRASTSASSRAAASLPAIYAPADANTALLHLIPTRVQDAAGWSGDIVNAMGALRVPLTPENLCSIIATVEQESSFQADPEVPNLPAIVRRELDARRERYSIPQFVLDRGLERKSKDGRTYSARIDALRTESDVSRLYEDVSNELPDIARRYQPSNPIHTAGAMQVNVAFAEDLAHSKPMPFPSAGTVRRDTFTRRGGLYYGIALLLDYQAPYPSPLYRFADYNAGRFSSRNAAFQQALTRVTGTTLTPDGDLLIYQDGVPIKDASQTQKALEGLAVTLGMNRADIRRELETEKTEAFTNARVWQRVMLMADASAGKAMPRYAMPQIEVHSPKFKRTLSTAGYASQVENRWTQCMLRQRGINPG